MDEQFQSLNDARLFFQFINTDKEAFTGKPYVPQKSNSIKPKRTMKKQAEDNAKGGLDGPIVENLTNKLNKASIPDLNEGEDSESRKLVNKSRAIKRIVQTSRKILQQNFKLDQPPPEVKKSHVTEFNLYFMQHKRLTSQIIVEGQQRGKQQKKIISELETNLENIYQYTVFEDFRELLQISLLKDKISKTNIHAAMDTFKQCLVILKQNELNVYEGISEDSPYRCIKLHQLENVDYFSQPYVFTVMTITKDRSAGSEFLSLRFDSHERQHKWDRAIFCNFITRTMKRKQKLFLYQFPEKENQKISKELGEDFNSYEVNIKKSIKNLAIELGKQRLKSPTRIYSSSKDFNREISEHMIESNMKLQKKKEEPNEIIEIKDSKQNDKQRTGGNIFQSKLTTLNVANTPNNNINEKKDSQPSIQRSKKSNGLSSDNEVSINKVESEVQSSNPFDEEKKSAVVETKEGKRKKQLKQKYKDGIIVKKQKFFNGKSKIIFLENQSLEYWDIDLKGYYKQNKKLIPIKDLKYQIVQKNSSIRFELPNKTLEFVGNIQDLKNISEWIQIQTKDILKIEQMKSKANSDKNGKKKQGIPKICC